MFSSGNVRQTAVAGMFYPQQAEQLNRMFSDWLPETGTHRSGEVQSLSSIPRALIVPHAGYVYSGQAAATGYACWQDAADFIKTIVVMGPAHRVGFHGITTVDFDAVDTPLGALEIDTALRDSILTQFKQVTVSNYAQQHEHSLEVHFPFIKHLFPEARVLPMLNGNASPEEVKQVLEYLWLQEGVYFVISSDLSHFHTYEEARQIDHETALMITHADWKNLNGERACGYKGIQGLLALKDKFPIDIQQLKLINSGDTAGDKSRVVGYGTWAIYEEGV